MRLALVTLACLGTIAAGQEVSLKPITVRTTANNYGASESSATGLDLSLRHTPHSVSVITESQLRDQNSRSLDRALRQNTGVSQQIYGSDRAGYNYLYARGNRISNYQQDGVPAADGLNDSGNVGTVAYERIEVVRGINGLLDGGGEPGASVNLVRKRPSANHQGSVSLGGGSRKNFNGEVDVGGALNGEGSLRGRAIVSGDRGDSWRRREHFHSGEVYGILEYEPRVGSRFYAGLNGRSGREKADAPHGIISYDSQGYATPLGPDANPATSWSYSDSRRLNLFLGAEHKLPERLPSG